MKQNFKTDRHKKLLGDKHYGHKQTTKKAPMAVNISTKELDKMIAKKVAEQIPKSVSLSLPQIKPNTVTGTGSYRGCGAYTPSWAYKVKRSKFF